MEANSDNFTVIPCANCGLEFCISKAFEKRRRGDSATFYCPNGHAQEYSKPKGDSPEVKKLKERIAQLETELEKAERKRHYDPDYTEALDYIIHNPGWVPPWRKEVTEDVPTGG